MRLRTVRMTSASGRRERQGETRLPPSRRERGVSRDRRCHRPCRRSIMRRKARWVFGIHYSIPNGRDSVSDVQWSQALTLVLVSASPPTAHGSTYIGVELPFCSSPAIHPMSSMRRACLLWPGSSIALSPVPRPPSLVFCAEALQGSTVSSRVGFAFAGGRTLAAAAQGTGTPPAPTSVSQGRTA